MSEELVEIEGIKIKREQIDLVKRTIFLNASDDELRLFFYECARRGVHPMDRLIFPVVRIDKEGNRRVAFQTGIDYLRAAAEETGRYVGQKTIEYGPEIPIEGHPEIKVPEWATAMVLRKDPESGEVVEVPHTVRWKEYYPGEKLGFMWRKMPYGQLGKCAEAGSLRKGFPRKLGGLYVNEEMERAEAVPFSDTTRKPIEKPQEMKTQPTEHPPVHPSDASLVEGKIENITVKTGGEGKQAWSKYTITLVGGDKFSTFDKKVAEAAKHAKEMDMVVSIAYKTTNYGHEIVELIVIGLDSQARETGED